MSLGDVQLLNVGKSDNGTPIYYELETQEIEMENRATIKQISDKIVVLMNNGIDSIIHGKADEQNYMKIPMMLHDSVNIGEDISLEGRYFQFKIFGESDSTSPVIEGFKMETITDLGLVK